MTSFVAVLLAPAAVTETRYLPFVSDAEAVHLAAFTLARTALLVRAALTRAIVTFTALTHGELVPVMVSRCLLTRSAPIVAVAEQPALVAGALAAPGAAVAATNGAASGAGSAAGGVVGATSASLSVKTVGPPVASWKRTSESWIEPVAG